jgi:hypothetical protein
MGDHVYFYGPSPEVMDNMSGISGTMRYRVAVTAKYNGTYEFNEARLRIAEIMDEARQKLAALGYESDLISRDGDGDIPSLDAALDEEERRRIRSAEIRAILSRPDNPDDEGNRELAERVKAALSKIK